MVSVSRRIGGGVIKEVSDSSSEVLRLWVVRPGRASPADPAVSLQLQLAHPPGLLASCCARSSRAAVREQAGYLLCL